MRIYGIALILMLWLFQKEAIGQQAWINAGPDDTLCSPVQINAAITDIPSTASYAVSQIAFAPEVITGVTPLATNGQPLPTRDDGITNALPIGFNFCFFDQTFNQFYISSNGWISFSPNTSATSAPFPIPSSNPQVPQNAIMGPWLDWNASIGDSAGITYETLGTAPFRRLVVDFRDMPMYGCASLLGDFQIVIYETTNVIENHLIQKFNCPTFNNGSAVQGIQNNGTVGFTVQGRNANQWTAANESWRYSPNGLPSQYTVTWTDPAGNIVGTGNPVSIANTQNTSYTATVTFSCSNTTFSDTVKITIGIKGVSITTSDVLCNGAATGSASATTNTPGNFQYSWSNGSTSPTTTALAAGTYFLTISDGACIHNDTVTITEPPPILITANIIPDTCGRAHGSISATASGGTGTLNFQWFSGSTDTFQVNLLEGVYGLVVTDANNCTDTSEIYVNEVEAPSAAFSFSPQTIIPYDPVSFIDNTTPGGSPVTNWLWNFGDSTSVLQTPDPVFFEGPGTYCISLFVSDQNSCADSIVQCVDVDKDILIPNVFTPNGDGVNDFFEVRNIRLYPGNYVKIYDRWGVEVLSSDNYMNNWNGDDLSEGTYYYIIHVPTLSTFTGFVTLLRSK